MFGEDNMRLKLAHMRHLRVRRARRCTRTTLSPPGSRPAAPTQLILLARSISKLFPANAVGYPSGASSIALFSLVVGVRGWYLRVA